MSDVTLNAYAFFRGNCREAMEFYKEIFGGDVTYKTFGEVPGNSEATKDLIIHADLSGGDIRLFASDTTQKELGSGQIELCLGGDDEERLGVIFAALGEGGDISHPLKKEFWGDTFGTLTDKYGVRWMVNIIAKQA